MKEIKTFFNSDHRLNKGYAMKENAIRQPDNNFYRKKFEHILPPIDIIKEYEEIYPGVLEQLLDMAKKEQNHRHSLDLVNIESANRAVKFGRISALIAVILICITTIVLTSSNHTTIALLFSTCAFISIGLISCISKCSCQKNKMQQKIE